MISIGDVVTWTTSHTRKVGRVWAVVPAGTRPEQSDDLSRFQVSFVTDYPFPRDHESYLVEVLGGLRASNRLYWPSARQLVVVARNGSKADLSAIAKAADRLQIAYEVRRWQSQGAEAGFKEEESLLARLGFFTGQPDWPPIPAR